MSKVILYKLFPSITCFIPIQGDIYNIFINDLNSNLYVQPNSAGWLSPSNSAMSLTLRQERAAIVSPTPLNTWKEQGRKVSVFARVISKTTLAYLSNKSPYYLLGLVQLGLILMFWMANEGPYAGKYHLQKLMKWNFSKLHWSKQLHNMRKNDHTSIYTWKWSSRTGLSHLLLKGKAWQSPQMFPSNQKWS